MRRIFYFIFFVIIGIAYPRAIGRFARIDARAYTNDGRDIEIGRYDSQKDAYKNFENEDLETSQIADLRFIVHGAMAPNIKGNYVTLTFKGEKEYELTAQKGNGSVFYFTESVKVIQDSTGSNLANIEFKVSLFRLSSEREFLLQNGYYSLLNSERLNIQGNVYKPKNFKSEGKDLRGKIEYFPEVFDLGRISNTSGRHYIIWRVYNDTNLIRNISTVRPTCGCTKILWPIPPLGILPNSYVEIFASFDPSRYNDKHVKIQSYFDLDKGQKRKCALDVFVVDDRNKENPAE